MCFNIFVFELHILFVLFDIFLQENVFSDVGNVSNNSLSNSLSELTSSLVTYTSPSEGTLFSQDLETANSLISSILDNLPSDTVQMVSLII